MRSFLLLFLSLSLSLSLTLSSVCAYDNTDPTQFTNINAVAHAILRPAAFNWTGIVTFEQDGIVSEITLIMPRGSQPLTDSHLPSPTILHLTPRPIDACI